MDILTVKFKETTTMRSRSFVAIFLRVMTIFLLLFLGVCEVGAQSKQKSKKPSPMPPSTPQTMKRTTNAQRWAAAAHHADRRAAHIRKHHGQVK
jgi:hypothetical protein